MKVRVVYKPDKTVSVIHLVENGRRKGETDTDMLNRCQSKISEIRDLPYDDIEETDLPIRDSNTRNKWRGEKGVGVKVDNSVILPHEKSTQELNGLLNTLSDEDRNSALGQLLLKFIEASKN